jgi:hypothetical protein
MERTVIEKVLARRAGVPRMTVAPSTRGPKGGPIRSSSAPSSLTVLVMTGDGHRRDDWAKYFEKVGVRPIRCAGPEATTCALSLEKRCPLHQEADFIFYEEESVTPQLEGQLRALPPNAPIAYARTKVGSDGREFPVATRIFSRTRPGR